MTKEEALKKIEELKTYIEECEEKEKGIPEMCRRPIAKSQSAIVCPPLINDKVTAWLTFNNDDTHSIWGLLSYELAQLLYAREYLEVDSEDLVKARRNGDAVYRVAYVISDSNYVVKPTLTSDPIYEVDSIWYFTEHSDAQKVCVYLNKYVASIKKEMY